MPSAPELVTLDLSDLASVKAAAPITRKITGDRLDLIVNKRYRRAF